MYYDFVLFGTELVCQFNPVLILIRISMISMYLSMITKPGKCREFKQTMDYIIPQNKTERYLAYDFRQSILDDDNFYIHAKWQDMKGLKTYLLSDQFKLLQGAIAVLCNPPEIEVAAGDHIINISFKNTEDNYREGQIHDKLDAAVIELENINK